MHTYELRRAQQPAMEKMGENEAVKTGHCLILPYSIQGHINPMLQFAKRLLHKHISITFVIPKNLAKTTLFSSQSQSISIETISDGFDDGAPLDLSTAAHLVRFAEAGSRTLPAVLERLAGSGRAVDCVVYDAFLPWALPAAKKAGALAAAFFTQSCAVDHIYHHVYRGDLKVPLSGEEIRIPGLPPLRPDDMPSFVSAYGIYPSLFEIVVNQFDGLDKADWLFYNTFYELEQEVINQMAKSTSVKAIGPTIPSMYLDKRITNDTEYGLNVYKPMVGACMEWLNQRQPTSVIYVSFGSLAKLDDKQMEELAWGLRLSNKHFLWVVRATEQSKLPKDFAEETSVKGLIVSWCPQLDVLSHEAICCFITHCGWNSTLEALSLGVPMVGIPQWTDQATNSKFVEDVWKMGVRARADENGLVGRETIASCIKEVLEEEKGYEMRKNVIEWKEVARKAMAQGGSSDLNIQEFAWSLSSQLVLPTNNS